MLAPKVMTEPFRDLVDLFERTCAHYAERPVYGEKRDGTWRWITYGALHAEVDRARAGLASLGVGKGDRVAIIANNRVEWAVAAHATHGLEAAFVPLYQAQRADEWVFILKDCDAKVAIVANDAIGDALRARRDELPKLERILTLDTERPESWKALLGLGEPVAPRRPDPDSIAGFIYTSGTTGLPKGVLQSHRNIVENVNGVHQIYVFEPEDVALSFLPWAHSYGQTCEVFGLTSMGASIAINDALENLLTNIAEVKPTILLAVPRIFNRIYESVNQQIGARPGFVQRIIRGGIQAAIKRAHGERLGPVARAELLFDEKLVFQKIRDRFGGRLKYAVSASATLGRDVAEFIDALGLTVYEGYGLTETAPIVSANFPGHRRMGSVGKIIPGVKVEIDHAVSADPRVGEIIVHGANVMVGYHRRPEENAKAFTPDHGLRTGDLGYLDDDGYLYITGRIKEQYKLENGKYVMPSPLEEELKLSPYVSNVMIYGDGRPFNVAIVTVDRAAVKRWAESTGVKLGESLGDDPNVRELIRSELDAHAEGFKPYERPREIAIVDEDFTTQNALMTPTLKLRRRQILERYGALLDSLYAKSRSAAA